MPSLMMCAGLDEVSNNARTRHFFNLIPASCKVLIEYERAKHVLEFSTHQHQFFQDLIWWFRRLDGVSNDENPTT